ncbi:hypothetical protein B9Z55_027864 [Caenorhabditis nigoni]|uniref:Uncharacterized protein n=1 Tax=Caenorhabditis nigoni TaxID=1611254 RepID=A0A2G5SE52_9PELO|nr:hypothetical protein B9Z55_027864 [Caenorhabditis nigoni]
MLRILLFQNIKMIHSPGGLHQPLSFRNDGQSIVGAIYLVMLVIWCLILGIFVCVNKCRKMKPKRRAIVRSESMRNVLKNLWFEGLQRPGIEMSEEFNADERIVVTNSERGQIDKIGHVAFNISQE